MLRETDDTYRRRGLEGPHPVRTLWPAVMRKIGRMVGHILFWSGGAILGALVVGFVVVLAVGSLAMALTGHFPAELTASGSEGAARGAGASIFGVILVMAGGFIEVLTQDEGQDEKRSIYGQGPYFPE